MTPSTLAGPAATDPTTEFRSSAGVVIAAVEPPAIDVLRLNLSYDTAAGFVAVATPWRMTHHRVVRSSARNLHH